MAEEAAIPMRNGDLFEAWAAADKENVLASVAEKIKTLLCIEECPSDVTEEIRQMAEYLCLKIQAKWTQCRRVRTYFLKRNKHWLQLPPSLPQRVKSFIKAQRQPKPGTSRGRPPRPFSESSTWTKKRRVADLVASRTPEELAFAAALSAHSSGSPEPKQQSLTYPQTLALYLDLALSERKYNILRSVVNAVHLDCFPTVHQLRKYRQDLLPTDVVVTETVAEVSLQSLLNKTAASLLHIVNDEPTMSDSSALTLLCKWGFDGSSGHSLYKQKFTTVESTDAFLFVTALVPLMLTDTASEQVVWSNPRPSSTLFCRPIRLAFVKESANIVMEEEIRMRACINALTEFTTLCKGRDIRIKYEMLLTMLDGSAITTLTQTSASQNCYICGATPKQMNSVTMTSVAKAVNPQHYQFGLSSLHSWIRCFECLLHISYRLPFKSWQVRGDEKKVLFAERKKRIQEAFKARMGLLVDVPKPGYGTMNDGNTARRFFSSPTLSSEITGIEESLIHKLGLVLRIIASGRQIHLDKFEALVQETRDIYFQHYAWYYMPSSVHKILIHGKDVISHFQLPIGLLSEEALEARHKEIRKHRLEHTRKSSRTNTNIDLMNMLLLTSDLFVSSLRHTTTKKSRDLDNEMRNYLIEIEPLHSTYKVDVPVSADLSSDDDSEFSLDSEA